LRDRLAGPFQGGDHAVPQVHPHPDLHRIPGVHPDGVAQLSWYGLVALPEMIACTAGLVYGWWTVTFKTWYVAKVTAAAPASPTGG
jgi:hypothetical protein